MVVGSPLVLSKLTISTVTFKLTLFKQQTNNNASIRAAIIYYFYTNITLFDNIVKAISKVDSSQ